MALIPATEWREEPGVEFWTASYNFEWTFENCTRSLLENSPVKLLSKPFGDNRWQISVGTIAKTPGYLGVFLGAAQDTEIQTSKTWIRRCESCTATLGTPNVKDAFGKEKNISGGYTFNASLESRRGQAKYIKLEKLFADAAFLTEKALFVSVTLSERRRTTRPSPFGDIKRFAGSSARFTSLFDDPDCSDVCFIFPKKNFDNPKAFRTIYAQKYIIRSLPYFNTMFESGFLESGETQSEVCEADNTCLSPGSHIPNQRFSSPLSSIELPTRIESGSTENDIDRHQQEQNEGGEDQEQKESQLCDGDDSVMMDSRSGVVDIVESVCGGDYDEDDSDFELDEMDDSVRGVQRAADHLTLADVGSSSGSPRPVCLTDRPTKKRRISQTIDQKPKLPKNESSSSGLDDQQTDNATEETTSIPQIKKGVHKVLITSTPYTTYRALLLYIYSNSIAWAPLRSTWQVYRERMQLKGKAVNHRRNVFVRENAVKFSLAMEMDELQPTSPKSMYILADMLQLPELRQEALDQFMRSLQVDNICIELMSSFIGKYDRVRQFTFEFLRSNKQVSQTAAFNRLMEDGLSSLSTPVRHDFHRLLKSLDPPSNFCLVSSSSNNHHSHHRNSSGNPNGAGGYWSCYGTGLSHHHHHHHHHH
ncbi:hypothetical protein PPACK8108_LOCUS8139 [Phakopsora pachyrhizi]|uniref:Uncharacterized protein n=1 Tax=Phakopsora pachyrhizi TaxID=170000 RepID=A0AAV0AU68_PHAPC|nr:hypothetical protein PPACK8108_LOCUS8139 [Phakopsora pachyrhizi]